MNNPPELSSAESDLSDITQTAGNTTDESARKDLFMEVMTLQRRVAFSNLLLNFYRIIATTGKPQTGHMCQYTGSNQGGELIMIEQAFTDLVTTRSITKDAVVQNGSLTGTTLPEASTPELSYDGTTIYFAAPNGGCFLSSR